MSEQNNIKSESSTSAVGVKKQSGAFKVWRIAYPPLTFLLSQFVVTIAGIVIYSAVQTFRSVQSGAGLDMNALMTGMMQHIMDNTLLFLLISNLLVLPLFLFLYYRDRKGMPKEAARPALLDGALVLALAVFANTAISALMNATDITQFFPDYTQLEQTLLGGSLLIRILSVGIIAPVVEEYLMRGVVLGRLRNSVSAVAALLIQAAIFGLLHLNMLQGSYAFLVGILFGYLYLKYGKILLCVLAHVAFNLVSVLLSSVHLDMNSWLVFAVSGVICALLLWAIARRPGSGPIAWKKKRAEMNAETNEPV